MPRYEIPLSEGCQRFTVDLGERTLTLVLIYRYADLGGWYLDIYDDENELLIGGIPLVIGRDLLEQYQHMGLGHLTASLDGGSTSDPTYEEMGSTVHLYWEPEDD